MIPHILACQLVSLSASQDLSKCLEVKLLHAARLREERFEVLFTAEQKGRKPFPKKAEMLTV
jgi:hypothetical protein